MRCSTEGFCHGNRGAATTSSMRPYDVARSRSAVSQGKAQSSDRKASPAWENARATRSRGRCSLSRACASNGPWIRSRAACAMQKNQAPESLPRPDYTARGTSARATIITVYCLFSSPSLIFSACRPDFDTPELTRKDSARLRRPTLHATCVQLCRPASERILLP
jgi:hypothetical protein